ncbi:MAG TPA: molybdopterin-dependent oxidoreductase [Motiliproteus sp.]
MAGEEADLRGGPPVKAMLVQNCNPAAVAPESLRVVEGLRREDLFLCVHEQFMTDTARYADIVLPATTFVEHDDLYTSFGHSYLQLGLRGIEPAGEAWSNHRLINALAARLVVDHVGFRLSEVELIDATLLASGYPELEALQEQQRLDCSLPSEQMRFLDGFAHPDGRFRFRPRWPAVAPGAAGMPEWPDYWAVNEDVSEAAPLKLITPPARNFLNTSFSETPSSRRHEQRPCVLIHPLDAARYQINTGAEVVVGNQRAQVRLVAQVSERMALGTLAVEGIWPASDFPDGVGINALVGADVPLPFDGAAFHDCAVWVRAS